MRKQMKKRLFAGVLVITVNLLIVSAVFARCGVDQIDGTGSSWIAWPILTDTYVAVASGANSVVVYGARPDGGVDRFRYANGWEVIEILPANTSNPYVALAVDGTNSNLIYGAHLNGGVDQIDGTGSSWIAWPILTDTYVAVASGANSVVVYGARPDGGVDRFRYANGWEVIGILSLDSYVALAVDGTNSNLIYGALTEDCDDDGVPDSIDDCPDTASGEIVDANGCSIAQHCPADASYKHGQYVSCVAHAAEAFLNAGLITEAEKDAIVSAAAQSNVGKPRKDN